jgi:hypothetical protein
MNHINYLTLAFLTKPPKKVHTGSVKYIEFF